MSDPPVTVESGCKVVACPGFQPLRTGMPAALGFPHLSAAFFCPKRPVGPVPTSAPRPRAFPVLVELTEGYALGALTEGSGWPPRSSSHAGLHVCKAMGRITPCLLA